MIKTLEELRIKGPKSNHNFMVTNSWGVKQAWRHIRKRHWFDIPRPVTEHEFYSILRAVNNRLAQEIALGHTVNFPCKMGKLELRKYKVGVSIVNGRLKNTYPIDWKKTKELWHNDEDAFKEKLTVRNETPFCFHVKYLKQKADYENKRFYLFRLNQKIKKQLKNNILNEITDTLW